jgi:hypothetical protein
MYHRIIEIRATSKSLSLIIGVCYENFNGLFVFNFVGYRDASV